MTFEQNEYIDAIVKRTTEMLNECLAKYEAQFAEAAKQADARAVERHAEYMAMVTKSTQLAERSCAAMERIAAAIEAHTAFPYRQQNGCLIGCSLFTGHDGPCVLQFNVGTTGFKP